MRCILLTLLTLALGARADAAEEAPVQLPENLSLEDALQIFRRHGYDLLLADSQIKGAEGDLAAAGAIPNPTWGLQGSYSFAIGSTAKPDPAWGVTAALGDGNAIEDAISGKRGLRRRVAQAALQAARLGRADVQRALEYQVKAQYLGALLQRDLLDLAVEVAKGYEKTFQLAHTRYMAGAISEADEAKVETAKLGAEQEVDHATEALRVAKLGLAFLLGVRGQVPQFHIERDLPPYQVPSDLVQTTLPALLEHALAARPDLLLLGAMREHADARLTQARRLRIPDLSLGVAYQQQAGSDKNAAQPPTIAFGISGVLPVFYFQRGEILRAEAELRQSDLAKQRLASQISTEVETAWTHFQSSQKLIERMQGRLLDRARRTRELVEIQYQKGSASLLELLDAQRQFIVTNVQYYQDLAAYWTAVYQLEAAVGMELH